VGANLTPDQLARLRNQVASNFSDLYKGAPILMDGRYYQAIIAGGGGGGDGGFDNPGTLTGFMSYPEAWGAGGDYTGQTFSVYRTDGSYSHESPWTKDGYKNLMLFAAVAGGLAFLPGGMVSTLSGAPAAGAAGSIAGDAFMPALAEASAIPYGSVLPGLEAYVLTAAAAGGAAAGTVAGDAFMPALAEASAIPYGSVLPGLEAYALPAAAAGAGTLASTVKGVANTASSWLSTAAKAASSLMTLKSIGGSGGGGASAPVGITPMPGVAPSLLPGVDNMTLLFLAGAVGLVAFVATRKG
jgi:hypothetical protein